MKTAKMKRVVNCRYARMRTIKFRMISSLESGYMARMKIAELRYANGRQKNQ